MCIRSIIILNIPHNIHVSISVHNYIIYTFIIHTSCKLKARCMLYTYQVLFYKKREMSIVLNVFQIFREAQDDSAIVIINRLWMWQSYDRSWRGESCLVYSRKCRKRIRLLNYQEAFSHLTLTPFANLTPFIKFIKFFCQDDKNTHVRSLGFVKWLTYVTSEKYSTDHIFFFKQNVQKMYVVEKIPGKVMQLLEVQHFLSDEKKIICIMINIIRQECLTLWHMYKREKREWEIKIKYNDSFSNVVRKNILYLAKCFCSSWE